MEGITEVANGGASVVIAFSLLFILTYIVPGILKNHRADIIAIKKRLDRIDHKLMAMLIDDPSERKKVAQVIRDDIEDNKND